MRRALFDIIQALRGVTRRLTAAALAERLEVTSISPRCLMRSTRRGKIAIEYVDERQRRTARTILPIAMACCVDVTVIAAWCALRQDKWINKLIGV